jgi:hypothetical protein
MPHPIRPLCLVWFFSTVLTTTGCDGVCTALEVDASLDDITSEDQSLIDAFGYFNLVGDCKTEALSCREYLPDTCEDACAADMTCIQVELRIDACGGSPYTPHVDPGDHWVRKCVEMPNTAPVDASVTQPMLPSDDDRLTLQ